jgi:hypothetical protein
MDESVDTGDKREINNIISRHSERIIYHLERVQVEGLRMIKENTDNPRQESQNKINLNMILLKLLDIYLSFTLRALKETRGNHTIILKNGEKIEKILERGAQTPKRIVDLMRLIYDTIYKF